jgi:hypothetical protein
MAATGRNITIDDVKALLGRAMIDGAFRQELLNDPAGTFTVLGLNHSDDSKAFFAALNEDSFKQAAINVEDRIGGRPVIAVWL